MLYKLASALIGSIHVLDDGGQTERVLSKAVDFTQKALENEKLLPEREGTPSSAVAGHVNLGMCYRLLGKEDRALASYDAALDLDLDNDAALIGRGLLRFRTDQTLAIEDFRKAVLGNSSFVWPYYFYAFRLVTSGQFDEGLRTCRAGLLRTTDPSLTAEFYEWIAIAQDALGQSRDAVQSSFENARSLAPWNQHIERNYQLFLQNHATTVGPPAWILDRGCDPEDASHRLVIQFSSQIGSWERAA